MGIINAFLSTAQSHHYYYDPAFLLIREVRFPNRSEEHVH